MKLSDYAKQVGVTYKTAWQWWKAGQLDAYQLPTGTIIVREPQTAPSGVALYARVSSADQQDDAMRQMQRLRDYAAARGYSVVAEVIEIASGLNDERPKLKKVLTDPRVGVIVVEQRDRLTRFGYGFIATLLEQQGRRGEAISPRDTGDGLVDDFVAVITSMGARMDGRPNSTRRAERIPACVRHLIHSDVEGAPSAHALPVTPPLRPNYGRLTGSVVVVHDRIQLPRLGRLRLKEHGYLPVAGVKILSATVSEQAGALVRLGPGGAGTSGASQHWPGSGRRPGHQDARDLLGWHRYSQSQTPQASAEEAQATAPGRELQAERQ